MPEGVLQDQISSSYSSDGILTISAPRVINAPGKTVLTNPGPVCLAGIQTMSKAQLFYQMAKQSKNGSYASFGVYGH